MSGRSIASLPCGKVSKWVVVVVWAILLAVLGGLSSKLSQVEKNDAKAWLPGAAESTKALDRLAAFQPSDVINGQIVYSRDSGLTAADKAKIAADTAKFQKDPGIKGQVSPAQVSTDGKAAQVLVPVVIPSSGWDKVATTANRLRDIADKDRNGLTVHVAGQAGLAADDAKAFQGIDGKLLFATVGVVIIILLLTYRSPVLWVLPLMSAGLALAVAEGVIYLLAKHAGLTVNAQSAGILTVLVFGAGTDYALLLVARYREELRKHDHPNEAMAVALHRAGPAVIASSLTVAAGMICLLVAELNSTKGLGPVCAIGVLVALAAMLTLLPALLTIFGRWSRWMFWPVKPRYGTPEPTERGLWARVGRASSHRPRIVWLVTALILGVMALGMLDLKAHGISNADSFVTEQDSIRGQKVLDAHFPAGIGDPLMALVNDSSAPAVASALAKVPGIADAKVVGSKGGYSLVDATLKDASDTPAAAKTVVAARAAAHAVPGADVKIAGTAAITYDVAHASTHDRKVIIPLILLVVFVILGLLLRAVFAPVMLIATVVLSFVAALGVSAVVFDKVFGFKAQDQSLPLFVFVFLVALGIDYNIFLMTRIREEAIKHGTRRGAVLGLATTGGVITSAGLVLAGTFAVLATLPLVAFAEIGFAVAFGVLLDTLVVRSVLVTSLTLDVGAPIWWPSALGHDAVEEEADAPITHDDDELAGASR